MTGKFEQKQYILYFLILVLVFLYTSEVFAISVEALKDPMKDLKKEVFDWMYAIKVAAVAVCGVFTIVKQSLTPFMIGGGLIAAITFFDKFIGDGAAALIG